MCDEKGEVRGVPYVHSGVHTYCYIIYKGKSTLPAPLEAADLEVVVEEGKMAGGAGGGRIAGLATGGCW